MGIEILLLILAALLPITVWVTKPITREALRQLQAERAELRQRIRQCDEELMGKGVSEEAKGEIQALRDDYRQQLHYLETRVEAPPMRGCTAFFRQR